MGDNRPMGSLLVVTGPPGAGKSTVAAILAHRDEPSALVAGDAFFAFLARGAIPPWLPESRGQNEVVTQAAGAAAGRYASGGYATVYDGVVGPWFLPTFAAATMLTTLIWKIARSESATAASKPTKPIGTPYRFSRPSLRKVRPSWLI